MSNYYSIYNKTLDELYYAEDKETAIAFVNDKARKCNKFIIKKVPTDLVTGNVLDYIATHTVSYSTESSRVLTFDEYEAFLYLDDYVSDLGKSLDEAFGRLIFLKDNEFIMDTLTSVMDALCEIAQICLYETIFEFGGELSLYLNVDVLTTSIIKNNIGRRK